MGPSSFPPDWLLQALAAFFYIEAFAILLGVWPWLLRRSWRGRIREYAAREAEEERG